MLSTTDGQRFDRVAIAKICENILWSIDVILPQVAQFQQKYTPRPVIDVAHMALSLRDAKERIEKAANESSSGGERPAESEDQ